MSRMLTAGLPAAGAEFAFRDESPACGSLPAGAQVVAEIKSDSAGKLILAAWPDYELHVATSCLLTPLEGDRIRAIVDQRKFFITDILSRQQAGELEINSGERALQIISPQLKINGGAKIEIKAENISLFSRTSQWVAGRMQQIAQRWLVQAEDAHRKVKYTERVEAGNISHQADEMLSVKGRMTSINGSAVVKVDGSQIHMG